MPEENVEVVKETIEALNRGDLDRVTEAAHEDLELDWSNSIAPHRGIYRGRETARAFLESFLEAWEEFRWELQKLIEVDRARVVSSSRVLMRGRGSGVEVDAIVAYRG
jgi:ketosteroid isomerase-like protein